MKMRKLIHTMALACAILAAGSCTEKQEVTPEPDQVIRIPEKAYVLAEQADTA